MLTRDEGEAILQSAGLHPETDGAFLVPRPGGGAPAAVLYWDTADPQDPGWAFREYLPDPWDALSAPLNTPEDLRRVLKAYGLL